LRHFPQRFIWISPQFGQRNFVASAPGAIGLPQLVHVVSMSVCGFSVILWLISRFLEWFSNGEGLLINIGGLLKEKKCG